MALLPNCRTSALKTMAKRTQRPPSSRGTTTSTLLLLAIIFPSFLPQTSSSSSSSSTSLYQPAHLTPDTPRVVIDRDGGGGGGAPADDEDDSPNNNESKKNDGARNRRRELVVGIDGGTESIRACCFDARTGMVVGTPCASPYGTSRPEAGWAEQDPEDWYDGLVVAVRGALASLPPPSPVRADVDDDDDCEDVDVGGGRGGHVVVALCCDTTCCSVVALSSSYAPLRPCLLWMDARSATQAREIMDVARSHVGGGGGGEDADDVLSAFPELRVNSAGAGPISAEWLLPKAMWMKQNEPRVWEGADVICEYQDYINHRLTGRMVASGCNAAVRWHHDGWEVVRRPPPGGERGDDVGGDDGGDDGSRGRPMGLYRALGMEDLAEKLPKVTLAMGDVVGGLADSASRDLGLPPGTPVVQGGPDAFVGMIGLGVVRPGMTCLITGSSHLHCLVTPRGDSSSPGTWGAYRGAPLPHLNFAEGGQSSTGSLVRWARDLFSSSDNDGVGEGGGGMISYKVLDDEASAVPPGCDGLVALETW